MRPRQKAGHMTAFVPPPNSRCVALESRAVPHMRRGGRQSRAFGAAIRRLGGTHPACRAPDGFQRSRFSFKVSKSSAGVTPVLRQVRKRAAFPLAFRNRRFRRQALR